MRTHPQSHSPARFWTAPVFWRFVAPRPIGNTTSHRRQFALTYSLFAIFYSFCLLFAVPSVVAADLGVSITPAAVTLLAESGPTNGSIDIGEHVQALLRLRNTGDVYNTNLVATLLATNGVVPDPTNFTQIYGLLAPGGDPVGRPFGFTTTGTYGSTVTAVLRLQDAGVDLGTASFTFLLPELLTFSNTNQITIKDNTNALPYPSSILVSGVTGLVGKVTVTVADLSHSFPQDIDVLLVGPTGQQTILMSGAGYPPVTDATVTFDDDATAPVPDGSATILSTSYRPATYLPDLTMPPPAPGGPYPVGLSGYTALDPNGAWSLFVDDHTPGDDGGITNGWGLALTIIHPVNQLADLGLSVLAVPEPTFAGDILSYLFTVTNAGPSTASVITFQDDLPANLTLVTTNASQGNLSVVGNRVTANLGALPPGSTASITLGVVPGRRAVGLVTNVATISAPELDLNTRNNTASVVSTIQLPTADLALALTSVPNPVLATRYITNVFSITNLGPQTAFDVVLTTPLSAGSSFISADSTNGTCTNIDGMVICQLGTLAPNATAFVSVLLTPLSLGQFTNTGLIGTTSFETNLTNNSAVSMVSVATPITPAGVLLLAESFSPPDATIEPGETVTVAFGLQNLGFLDTSSNFTATLQLSGGITNVAAAQQLYGVLPAGGPPVSRPFTFTAAGTNGGLIIATLVLQDGINALGTAIFTFNLPATTTLSNTAAITIPDHGAAAPYPSTIVMSGLTGLVTKVTATLIGFSHSYPRDVSALLVSPSGASSMLLSHVGGPFAVTNVILAFDDAASASLSSYAQLTSGTYKPTSFPPALALPAPAPAPPYALTLSALVGQQPNGPWGLYVFDDTFGDAGAIARGWSLTVKSSVSLSTPAVLSLTLSNNQVRLTLAAQPFLTYAIQVSTNLASWTSLCTNTIPSDGQLTACDATAANCRFYRAVLIGP